jgi:ribonuclease HI
VEALVVGDQERTRLLTNLFMPAKKKKYYAYFVPTSGAKTASGVKQGVTDSWAACERFVSGKTGARFKAFDQRADAEAWLVRGAMYEARATQPRSRLAPGIYFDAGTGRGDGVEVSVTDEHGKNLLHKAIAPEALNTFGKHLLDADVTNNYGELLALRYAIEIAQATQVKKIFGDSKLVIDFWSQWRIKRKELPEGTVALADEVSRAREAFEKEGGTVERISGDINPADLGFHR